VAGRSPQAVRDNAESAARGILAGNPEVIVVVASAAEASGAGMETIKALAALKDGPAPKPKWGSNGKWGFGGGGGRACQILPATSSNAC